MYNTSLCGILIPVKVNSSGLGGAISISYACSVCAVKVAVFESSVKYPLGNMSKEMKEKGEEELGSWKHAVTTGWHSKNGTFTIRMGLSSTTTTCVKKAGIRSSKRSSILVHQNLQKGLLHVSHSQELGGRNAG